MAGHAEAQVTEAQAGIQAATKNGFQGKVMSYEKAANVEIYLHGEALAAPPASGGVGDDGAGPIHVHDQ